MAYSDSFPAVRPVFQSDFANGGRIDPRITFSRSDTPPTYAAPSAVHYWSNEKHLSSENLILQSEDFTTSWSTQDSNGSAGATAPDGGTDAYTITAHSASGKAPRVSQSLSGKLSTSTQYTMVGHVKAGTATHGYISFRGNNVNNYAYAQIEFASPSSPSTGGVGFSGISGTVTALGSSWYRLTLTATTGSDVSGAFAFLGVNDGTAFTISGYPEWTSAGETLEVWGAQISTTQAKVYDSPTTTQIARSYAPSLKSVSTAGQPRFEFSPTDSASMGLLIEGSSTNAISYSDSLSNWNEARLTVTDSSAVGPTGSLNASLLTPTSANGTHSTNLSSVATNVTGTVTVSGYFKSAGYDYVTLGIGDTTTTQFAHALFNLSTGAYVANNVSGNSSYVSSSTESVGNGWWRLVATFSTTEANEKFVISPASSGTPSYNANWGVPTYAGDDYSGVLAAGLQGEVGKSFASSLITSNSGSETTRAVDSASMDLTAVGNEVTVVGEAISTAITTARETVFHAAPSGSTNVSAYAGRATGGGTSSVFYGGSTGVYLSGSTVTAGGAYKFALRTAPANHGMSYNGGTVATETTTVGANDFDTLHIGGRADGSNKLNGHIKRLAVFGEALSDTNLISLTK